MNTAIYPYNKADVDTISQFLCEYGNTRDYRYLFSSKEWLLSFIEIYSPQKNFLVRSRDGQNYFSLSISDDQLFFTGDPFNDFNGIYVRDPNDVYDCQEIIKYFAGLGYQASWLRLFEEPLLGDLKKSAQGIVNKRSEVGLKITIDEGVKSYDSIVSKRILRMYQKFSDRFSFFRTSGDEMNNNHRHLETLLTQRRNKLLTKKSEEYNCSFEQKFNEFIKKLPSFPSLWKNIFLDYYVDKKAKEIIALTLNFIKNKNVICYLRAHAQSANDMSYGLILDYWSNTKNIHDGVETVDLSRGNESYKYRLGAKEYYLSRFDIL